MVHYHTPPMVTISQRQFPCFLPLNEELQFEPNRNYLCTLSNHAVLEVTGDKAIDFLQGQLTCNLHEVNQTNMRQGALCNSKGRILTLLDIVSWQERLYLILPYDLLEATRLTLSKTAVFSRVSLISKPSIKIYGLFIQKTQPENNVIKIQPKMTHEVQATNEYCCYRLTTSLSILLSQEPLTLLQNENNLDHAFIDRGPLAWHALTLQAGMFSIYPGSRGLFLPHHLGLHRTSIISFEKGCYKGQEIIARMQYRAKIKHKMRLVRIETNASFFAGQKIFEIGTQHEIGEVIDFCPGINNQYLVLLSLSKPEMTLVHFENHTQNIYI